jgi:hypothetical protein
MELPEDDFGHPRWEKAEEMNKLATKIYGLYESLIRDCKRRIGTPLI